MLFYFGITARKLILC